jgi:hypothetical protein
MYNLSREQKKYTVSVTMSETLYTREQEKGEGTRVSRLMDGWMDG